MDRRRPPAKRANESPPPVTRPARGLELPHLQRVLDPLRLRLVMELDRRGSISRAAEACAMGQPTASMHLRTLEAATGRRLYERTARGTQLTDAGRLLARHADVVLGALDGLTQELAALDRGQTGTLRVSVCESFGNYLLPDLLSDFMAEHPGADVHVHVLPSEDVVDQVARGEAHTGVAGETRRVEGATTERLLHDELIGVAARGHAAGSGDIAGHPLILSSPASSTRLLTERWLRQLDRPPARTLEVDSIEAVKRAVRSGAGIAVVSRMAVRDELRRGELEQLSLPGVGSIGRWIDLVRNGYRVSGPLERAFERSLRALRDR